MINKKVDEEKLKEEKRVQQNINQLIDNQDSFVFKAGAGSGKTFALVESLKYLLNKKRYQLQNHNQQIIVITYTNIATNEIKERLGNSQLVLVSTIHERMWDLIGKYKQQLLEIHLMELENEINRLNMQIDDEDRFSNLSSDQRSNFVETMESNKEVFYKHYNDSASIAKESYKTIELEFDWVDGLH